MGHALCARMASSEAVRIYGVVISLSCCSFAGGGKHDFREFRTVKYAVRVGYAAEGGIERGQHFAVLRAERAVHRVRVHPARAEGAHTRGNRAFAGAAAARSSR